MSFRPVFSLHLIHRYYSDGICPDFLIEPTSDTDRRLRNHRCVLKAGPNWIRAYMEPDLIPLEQGETFEFSLRLRNPNFALFTDMREVSSMAAPLYTNVEAAASSTRTTLSLKSRPMLHRGLLVVDEPVADARFSLSVPPLTGLSNDHFRVASLGSVTQVADYNEAEGFIILNTSGVKKGAVFKIEYPISPPLRRDVFADVEICVNKPDQEGQKPALGEYQIEFEPKQARWIYYLVTNHSADQFGIEGKGPDAISFTATDLKLQPDPTDEIASSLANQHGDSKRFRFVSDELVECRQAARKNIQLRGGADLASSSVLAAVLPNPSLGNLSTTDQHDSLFQIFRYVTHSFSTSGG